MSVDAMNSMQEFEQSDSVDPVAELIAFRESEEGAKLLDFVLSKYKSLKSSREREEREWKQNLALYNGLHYTELSTAGKFAGQFVSKPPIKGRERLTLNRIESVIRTEIARLTSQKPSASVVPASSDQSDMFAAMAGEQIWRSVSDRRSWMKVFSDAAFWITITGNGFVKTYWDDSAVDRDAETYGDIIFENISPFNLLVPDLRETEIERQPFLINYYTKPLEWIYSFYEKELDGIKLVPNANAANEVIEDTWLNLSSTESNFDSCIVYELWAKPGACKQLPNGGYVTVVDNVIVAYQEELPYVHQEYPFAHFGHIPTGKFYRRSVINSLRDPQKEYNSVRSQLADARKRMARPQILAPKGSIKSSRMSNETGLIIEYNPGFGQPTPMPLSDMPNYVLQEQERILVDIEDISGQHQVSKGNVPPGVTAATAISYLQEKDDSYLSPTQQSVEFGTQKVARQTLMLVVQFWDIPRLVKVAGDDSYFDTLTLAGSEIKNGTDIRIEPGSSLPMSKAARQALVTDWMTQGFLTPEQGFEILDIGGAQVGVLELIKNDKRQAQRENVRMAHITEDDITQNEQMWGMKVAMGAPETIDQDSGQRLENTPPVVTVNDWDNHQVHIDTHNAYRRSQAFEFLSEEVKAQFESHVQMHKQMLIQSQLQNMLQGLPTDGSVPGVSGLIDNAGQVTDGGGPGVSPESSLEEPQPSDYPEPTEGA